MFGIGSTELLVIFVVALIVLGPKSIPQLAKTLGKAMGEFKRVSTEFQRTMNAEVENEEHEKRKKEAEEELFGKEKASASPTPPSAPPPPTQEAEQHVAHVEPDAIHSPTQPDVDAFAPDSPLAKAVAKAEADAAQRDVNTSAAHTGVQTAAPSAQATDSTKGNA